MEGTYNRLGHGAPNRFRLIRLRSLSNREHVVPALLSTRAVSAEEGQHTVAVKVKNRLPICQGPGHVLP